MKILTYLLLFITCHAVGQTFVLVPKELLEMANQSGVKQGFIQLKGLNKTTDTLIYSDGSHYYLIASGDGNNSPGTKIRVQITQIPVSDVPVDTIPDPPAVTVIDTIDAVNSTFVGKWSHAESATAKWYGSTLSFSNETGAYATYKHALPYRRVEIWAEQKWTHGKVQIFVDNIPIGDPVDLYNPAYKIPHLVFRSAELPLGIHEIKYQIVGQKNPASIGTYGLIDYFRFFR